MRSRQVPPMKKNARLPARLAVVALAGSVAIAGCRGRSISDTAPVAALAQSRGAQEAFRPLRQRFVGAERSQRALLEANLTWFVTNYPKDGLTPLAKVYLALIAVDKGQVDRARELVHDAQLQPSGTTRDLAELVEGAILLKRKSAAQAFEHSLPLVGKLIDPYARILLDEHIVMAGFAAKRWYEAVAYMDLWLRDAPEDDAASVRAAVRRALESIPGEALELMLQAMRTAGAGTGYGTDIRKGGRRQVGGSGDRAAGHRARAKARRIVERQPGAGRSGRRARRAGIERRRTGGGRPLDWASGFDREKPAWRARCRGSHRRGRRAPAHRVTRGARSRSTDDTRRDARPGAPSWRSMLWRARALRCSSRGSTRRKREIAAAFASASWHSGDSSYSPRARPKSSRRCSSWRLERQTRSQLLVEALVSQGARSVAPVGGSVPTG